MTPPALRPFLPADAPLLAAICRDSIVTLAEDDYSEDQLAAWASIAEDEDEFGEALAGMLTLVGLQDGMVAGFAALADGSRLAFIHVRPDMVRRGVGRALVGALERLAAARGATALSLDAPDNARAFFDALGYRAERRLTLAFGDEWLGATQMTKSLAPAAATPPGRA